MIKLAGAKGLKVFAEIRKGDPADVLMTEATDWRADCIFIGAAGFGSANDDSANRVSTQLATNASCSIEIVR
jgi:nucleotide-binding universal stress UspA family protein